MGFSNSILNIGFLLLTSIIYQNSFAEELLVLETSPDGIQRADITADSYSYTPDQLIVKINVPVELTIRNKTWIVPHTFVLKDSDSGLVIHQDIPAEKSTVVRFIPTHHGKVKFYCDKKLLFFKSHEDQE